MDLRDIYKQLTNVDIEEQRRIWDERGKGYYGEYLLFCELYKNIIGTGKILMNLCVPTENGGTTEIDLLLIHETGLYVFEIKHYKGTIYGKDTDGIWTQYFRTTKNNTFKNPIEQNGYHIRALKQIFPNTPIHSIIVFTSSDCELRINNSNDTIDICLLRQINTTLSNRFSKYAPSFTMDIIDSMFNQLAVYSQMREDVKIDCNEAPFLAWVTPTINGLEAKKAELEKEKSTWQLRINSLKKQRITGIFTNIAIALLCIIVSLLAVFSINSIYEQRVQANNFELAKFKQNFLHVDQINNKYIDALNSYVEVSNIVLEPLTDDAVSFSARLAVKNDVYGIALTENTKYIVITTSGQVFEYNAFGEHLRYNRIANMVGTGIRSYGDLNPIQFYGISKTSDISYIKLTGIELFKLDIKRTVIKDELEIELYSANS